MLIMVRFSIFVLISVVSLTSSGQAEDWQLSKVPHVWKSMSSGSGQTHWCRCVVKLPAAWADRPIQLFVESVDDAREIFVNGESIGRLGSFPPEYRSGLGRSERFAVPRRLLSFGQGNVIGIRVHQNQSRSGFNVAAPVLFAGNQAIRLVGNWESKTGDDARWSQISARRQIAPQAIFSKPENAADVTAQLRRLDDEVGALDPSKSLAKISHPTDLEVDLALSEPEVLQPLSFKWDQRGRLWVNQYLQYPDPAGLRMVSRDKFLRTVYDKMPLPPPHHEKGRDKITIHEDTTGDGVFDSSKTFIDGLNMVTSFAIGRGGVWVLNPPYLLFYADSNQDDLPDGAPEVCLEGFGLEDSHSLVNNLRWGPDGWLYAAQGSTVSGRVKRYGSEDPATNSMGQLIWRYHPELRRYEVFAEGGGNAFGVEIDRKGRIFSGHNGQNTRGFHYPQGGYLQKGFGKHGQLSNPYTFGYLGPMQHHKAPRFSHAFVIYESTALPANYQGQLFAVSPLHGRVVKSQVGERGSTFQTKDQGYLFESSDSWCRPIDIQVGPDGCFYVADFYEQRIDHASHYQGRVDRTSGRIYRIRSASEYSPVHFDATVSNAQLMSWQEHPNRWYRQTALRLFGDRKDISLIPQLISRLRNHTGQLALESLWAINLTAGLSDELAIEAMQHEDPYVRLWATRLVCDDGQISPALVKQLIRLAQHDPSLHVRCQLACSARRLPADSCLAIVRQLLTRSEDLDDPQQPLLIWWAIEDKADSAEIAKLFNHAEVWDLPVVSRDVISKIMRRYAQEGTRDSLQRCAALLRAAPSPEHAKSLLDGFEQAYQGRDLQGIPPDLSKAIIAAGGGSLELRLRQGDRSAFQEALAQIQDENSPSGLRVQLINVLGELRRKPAQQILLDRLAHDSDNNVRNAILAALQAFDESTIATSILHLYPEFPSPLQKTALTTLASREHWAERLITEVEAKRIASANVPAATIGNLWLHRNKNLQQRLRNIWGNIPGATTDEMRTQIEQITHLIKTGSGVPNHGKPLFIKHCGKCHRLFEDGGDIGPNLTQHDRLDLRQMIVNIVNPSLALREGFESHVILTTDGRTINGLMVDQDNQVLVIKNHQGQKQVIPRSEVDDLFKSARSLMPTDTLTPLTDQQVRDLFAYLRSSQPLP